MARFMPRLTRSLTAALLMLAAFIALPAAAETDKALLKQLGAFEDAVREADGATVAAQMPPSLIVFFAGNSSRSPEDMRRIMADGMSAAMKTTDLISVEINIDLLATDTAGGSNWALVPVTSDIRSKDGVKVRSISSLFAVEEDGAWYLMRIENAGQADLLKKIYPQFADVEIPLGSLEILE